MKSILLFSFFCIFLFSTAAEGQLDNHFEQLEVSLKRSKKMIPLSLPNGTTSYFYSITIVPKNKQLPAQESLYSQLLRQSDDQPLEQLANRVRVLDKRDHSVNVILIQGADNAEEMKVGTSFNYFEYFLDQSSGARYMSTGPMEDVYLLLENRRIPRKYRVLVEVVAVVE